MLFVRLIVIYNIMVKMSYLIMYFRKIKYFLYLKKILKLLIMIIYKIFKIRV